MRVAHCRCGFGRWQYQLSTSQPFRVLIACATSSPQATPNHISPHPEERSPITDF